jgi:S1-C subfamily serine protease/signal transduction histidine kinase
VRRAATGGAVGLQSTFEQVIRRVSPSVVQIETGDALGSGIVFDDRGDIVTNNHVVGTFRTFSVTLSGGGTHDATLVGTFPPDDLAVIRLTDGTSPPAAAFADSSRLQVGQLALAIGNPLGLRSSVTEGIVSSLGRTVSEGNGVVIDSAIQTSAAINPGNSGGALVDLSGAVIGIPTLAAVDPQLGGSEAPGIGFAIPSSTVTRIANQLIADGHVTRSGRAFLGVEVATPVGGVGVIVVSVDANGPAADAGIRRGEAILALDGRPTVSTDDLSTVLAGLQPGQRVPITVLQANGRRVTLQITLGQARVALADEQAALRRLAALAGAGEPPVVFDAIAEEIARIVDFKSGVTRLETATVVRYESNETLTVVAWWGPNDPRAQRASWPLDGYSITTQVYRTARPARVDDYAAASGTTGNEARERGYGSSVGVPIVVDGRLWGAACVFSARVDAFAPDTEARLADFARLAAIAIANAEVREQAERLMAQQSALRQVATLVARGVPSSELFAAVAETVGRLLEADLSSTIRYDGDEIAVEATWAADGEHPPVDRRWPIARGSLSDRIRQSGRPSRIDDWSEAAAEVAGFVRENLGITSSVGSPIVVDGRLWGLIAVHAKGRRRLAADAEARIGSFVELVATAISNAQVQLEVRRLGQEQAALRLVATLVARQSSPSEVFSALVEEVGRVLGVESALLMRYGAGHTGTPLAIWGDTGPLTVGRELSLEGPNVSALVRSTGRATRFDAYEEAPGQLAASIREMGIRVAVGSPIAVAGEMWGALIAATRVPERLPPGSETRMQEFTELAATSISNMQARADLAASRARIVVATDEARRRFERDLHDGAQQRLVSLALELRGVEALAPPDLEQLRAQLTGAEDGIVGVLDDLRELSRGVHPAILSEGGFGAALRALARRCAVPVELTVELAEPVEERVEVAACYVVSEALANTAKHAGATVAVVHASTGGGLLDLTIADDGAGGADPARGSGLMGLVDRVEALGGAMAVDSSRGHGTSIRAKLPVAVEIPDSLG